MGTYETNFHKEKSGNSLHSGEDLTITINGNPVYITGILYKRKSFGRKQIIQIEQSGHRSNPSKESITFEMKDRGGQNMERGRYRVLTTVYFTGRGGNSWGDNFEIV